MRILRHTDPGFARDLAGLQRSSEPHPDVEATVREVIRGVRERGDAALLQFTEKFGGPKLTAPQLRVTARSDVDAAMRDALLTAHTNVRAFADRSLRKSWASTNAQGARVGER